MAQVDVQLQWPADLTELPPGAQARVTVEDASRADDAASVIAETVVRDLEVSRPPRVAVEVGEFDPAADLYVRVHVTGGERATREVEVADLVTTQSHPVLTHGYGDSVVVPLRLVGS
jgi:hypothetical protein